MGKPKPESVTDAGGNLVGGVYKKVWTRTNVVWNYCNPLKSHKTANAFFGNVWRKQAEIWKCLEKAWSRWGRPEFPWLVARLHNRRTVMQILFLAQGSSVVTTISLRRTPIAAASSFRRSPTTSLSGACVVAATSSLTQSASI